MGSKREFGGMKSVKSPKVISSLNLLPLPTTKQQCIKQLKYNPLFWFFAYCSHKQLSGIPEKRQYFTTVANSNRNKVSI